jgi:hypothetical protein
MATTIWIDNNGDIYHGGGIVIGDLRYFHPTPEQFREAGYTEYIPPTPVPPSTEDFDNACVQFRQVCAQIALATGIEGFKGGFDEMYEFQQSPVFATLEGMQLATAWNAADKLCTYEASKIGIGQPQWWYKCWEEELADAESVEETVEPEENGEEQSNDVASEESNTPQEQSEDDSTL